MNYTWYYVVRINTKHKVLGWMPCLNDRARAHYRLKNARGLFRIRRVPAIEFNISRVCVTPVVKDFALHPVCGHGKRLPWEITRIGTTIPRSTANPLQTFYVLYNYARESYMKGEV